MLLTKSYQALVVLLLSIIVFSCESPTVIVEPNESDKYLNVGDISQYYYQNSVAYEQDEIIGKTKRSDGLEVFITESKYKSNASNGHHIIYSFIRSGYYYTTELEKTSDPIYNDVNPFKELKLYKINLNQGDSWKVAQGVPDSNNIVFFVNLINQLETPAAIFNNVYSVNYYDKYSSSQVDIYYSEEFGRLGIKVKTETILLNYIKKQNTELGKKVEF